MQLNVLLCDSADELARLQYHFLRAGADLAVEVTTDPFRAVEMAARTRPDVVVCEPDTEGPDAGRSGIARHRAGEAAPRVLARFEGARVDDGTRPGSGGPGPDRRCRRLPHQGRLTRRAAGRHPERRPRGRSPSPPRWRGTSARNWPDRAGSCGRARGRARPTEGQTSPRGRRPRPISSRTSPTNFGPR